MKFVTTSACCCLSLRFACRMIAIIFLIVAGMALTLKISYFSSPLLFIGLILSIIANIALLIGAQLQNHWCVLVWLVHAAYIMVCYPIAIMGVILNFGGYREASKSDSIFRTLFIYTFSFTIFWYCVRIVFSYWMYVRVKSLIMPSNV